MASAPVALPVSRARSRAGLRLALILAVAAGLGARTADAGSPGDLDTGWEAPPMADAGGAVPAVADLPEPVLEDKTLFSGAPSGVSLPKQGGGAELKLQWRSERYTPGPQGIEIDGSASGVEIGVNYKLRSAIRIGALAQFDPAGEALFASQRSLSDRSWMAGPVTTIQFAPGLTLEARAAWGLAEAGADDLHGAGPAAQRRLLNARLAHPHAYGAWRFTPTVSLTHLREEPPPASAELEHATGSGRVDFAPEFAYRFDFARRAFIEPKAVLGGFWTFDDLSKAAPGVSLHADPRLKAEAGVTFGVVDGPKLQALGGVEGGDTETPDVWTGRLQLSVPLK